MKSGARMAAANVACENMEISVEEMLRLAGKKIPAGHILAESPRHMLFERFDKIEAGQLRECRAIIIFDDHAELRMEKDFGSMRGICRFICDDQNGKQYYARNTSYILHGAKNGRLRYAEYFTEEASGFLKLAFGRICGITREHGHE